MKSYPANHYGKGDHTIRYTFQSGTYKGTAEKVVGGNCKGGNVFNSVEHDVEYILEDDYPEGFTLKNPAGGELLIDESDILIRSLVKIEIIDFKAEEK